MNRSFLSLFFLGIVRISSTLSSTLDEKCQQNQTIKVHFWDQRPYIYEHEHNSIKGFFTTILQESLKHCCQATTRVQFVKIKSGPAGLLELVEGVDFDLVVPVGGLPHSKQVRGLPYIDVASSSGAAVLMLANASGAKLLLSVLQAWPILVFIIVSALLAGVLMWYLERKGSDNQFSTSFGLGTFEGFWWAFCTMTTVGYGDRAPKTVLGKILGSVWMLIGVIITTMFISIITTALTQTSYKQYNCIRGMKVSVVNQSQEHYLAIRNNADIHALPNQKLALDHVINRHVEISLIDTHALKEHISSLTKLHIVVASVVTNYVNYGILLSTHSTRLETCLAQYMELNEAWRYELLRQSVTTKRVHISPAEGYFGSGGIFSISVYSGVGLFVVLFCFGLLWEFHKSKKSRAESNEPSRKTSIAKNSNSTNTRNTTVDVISKDIYRNGGMKPLPSSLMSRHSKNSQHYKTSLQQSNILSPPPQPYYGDTPREKLVERQKMEVMELESDFNKFHKEWEKRYKDLQRKQRRDDIENQHKDNRNGGHI